MEVDEINNKSFNSQYELSVQLTLHSAPVRCIEVDGNNCIVSAGTKEEFIEWRRIVDSSNNKNNNSNSNSNSNSNNDNSNNDNINNSNNNNNNKSLKEKMDVDKSENKFDDLRPGVDFSGSLIFDKSFVAHPLTFCLKKHTLIDENLGELYLSGGSDNRIIIWNLRGEPIQELNGHTKSVNSIDITDTGEILSGSFDGTAKIWKNGSCLQTLTGHKYGVEVCSLSTGEIVTASHKNIQFWDLSGKKINTINNAHSHVIRKIRRHKLGFVTCGNDGYIKLWTNKGDKLIEILAHPESGDHPSFIYDIYTNLDNGNIVSCGEDGSVKLYKSDGTLLQIFPHPGAVWSVKQLNNGDIVTGCADRVVRIWTKSKLRIGNNEMVQNYYNLLEEAKKLNKNNNNSQTDYKLEDFSELNFPGKPGEYKMVKDPSKGPSVYQWDAQTNKWTYIGQITGNPNSNNNNNNNNSNSSSYGKSGKPRIGNVEYDHVTHIDINGDSSRPLGFNVDDDPKEVARRWCIINCVDLDQVPRIVEHLKPLQDPIKRKQRVLREKRAKDKLLTHIPNYLKCSYEINSKMQLKQMKERILKFNNELKLSNDLNIKNLYIESKNKAFNKLFDILSDQKMWHVNNFDNSVLKLIENHLIKWPNNKILPVLDMLRVLMLHGDGVNKLGNSKIIRNSILTNIEGDVNPFIHMITCRLISNFLAKRIRSEKERSNKEIPNDLVEFLVESLQSMSSCATNKKASVHTAYIMLCHNTMLWFSKFRIEDSDLYIIIASALSELLSTQKLNDKILYYCLSIIGTIGWCSNTAKENIKDIFDDELKNIILKARNNTNNNACKIVGKDLWNLFKFDLEVETQV